MNKVSPDRQKSFSAAAKKNVRAAAAADKRKFDRVKIPLRGRYLTEERQEMDCEVANISAGGALLRAKNPPKPGEKIIIYIEDLGRFEAKVLRAKNQDFAIQYISTPTKTNRTADRLMRAKDSGRIAPSRRAAPRYQQDAPALVQFEDGRTQECAILDISLTGASIEIKPRPPLGASLILGRMKAKVVRRHDAGIGVIFTGPSDEIETTVQESTAGAANIGANGAELATQPGKRK